ncbi:MAG: rhodanese-like domain-containing protein [Opitutales bacterium]
MKSWIGTYCLIFLGALLIGAANWAVNPNRPEWAEDTLAEGEISISGLSGLADPLLLDARSQEAFAEDHIPGALLLNEDAWESLILAFFETWDAEQAIVVYCSSNACQASHAVADRLKAEIGVDEIYVLKGGWEAWLEADRQLRRQPLG